MEYFGHVTYNHDFDYDASVRMTQIGTRWKGHLMDYISKKKSEKFDDGLVRYASSNMKNCDVIFQKPIFYIQSTF